MSVAPVHTAASVGVPTEEHEVINTVMHHALVRDFGRFATVLSAPVSTPRRQALVRHLEFVLEALHHHHTNEDDLIWPKVLLRRPDLAALQAEMEAEHDVLDGAIRALTAATREWESIKDDRTRLQVRDAVIALDGALAPHLAHEEAVGMPAIVEALTASDWAELDKSLHKIESPAKTAKLLFWLLDSLDARRASVMRGLVPAPLFATLRLAYGGRYRRTAQLLWGSLASA